MTCKGYANGCTCAACQKRSASHNTAGIVSREVRQFIDRYLTPYGFRRTGTTGEKHPLFEHGDTGQTLTTPSTPSDPRWLANTLAAARRINPSIGRECAGKRRKRKPAPINFHDEAVQRLQTYAEGVGLTLDSSQATEILKSQGSLASARTFLNKIVTARRRELVRAA